MVRGFKRPIDVAELERGAVEVTDRLQRVEHAGAVEGDAEDIGVTAERQKFACRPAGLETRRADRMRNVTGPRDGRELKAKKVAP